MKLLFTIILLAVSFAGFSQSQFISFSGHTRAKVLQQPLRSVQDYGIDGLDISYHFENMVSVTKTEKTDVFSQLSIAGFSHLQEVGKPALPSHIDLVAIPDGAEYNLEIMHDIPLVKNGFRIYPALQPARDTEGAPEPEFEIDSKFYKQNKIFPAEPVRIKGIIKIRGLRHTMVEVMPVQYNPATGQIFLHENLNYKIRFSGSQNFMDYTQHSRHALDYMSKLPLNGESLRKEAKAYYASNKLTGNSNHKDYIIITHSNFLAAADSLANWKRQMGYSVEVVSQSSWTSTQVQNAVSTRYNNMTPKPDYLLIMGDHQFVPAKILTNSYGDNFGSDLYYVCMDGNGDYVPDMAKGRISANSASDAMLQVMKIINYERNPVTDTSFYQNGLNCAQFQDDNHDGYADRRFTHTSEDVRNYVVSKGYNVQRIYYTASNVTPLHYNNGYYSSTSTSFPSVLKKSNGFNWNGGSSNITTAINAGKFYVLHRDHGYSGGSGWAHPYYVNSKISNLTNGNKLPVVFSINCHTGEFTQNSCLSETFMRKTNGGAVGVVGASYYSYSGYNDGFSIGMFDAIWSNPGLVPVFGSGGISNPNVSPHSDIVNMGDVLNHGLIREIQTWGGSNTSIRYTHELFHYFGDPAMRIYTAFPQQITAMVDTVFNCTDTALQISNCNFGNAIVSLTSNNQLISRIQLSNGNGYLPLIGVVGNVFKLTISARDARPMIKTIQKGAGGVFSASSIVNNPICMGDSSGNIKVYPGCGTPPYQIIWSTGDTSMELNNVPAGTYTYILTDSMGASITDTVVLSGPSQALTANAVVTNPKCYQQNNGSISVNVQGGHPPYSYLWNTGATTNSIHNVGANTYSVLITDSVGCETQKSYTLTQPAALVLSGSKQDDATGNCTGSAGVSVTGGTTPYTYLWNDPNAQTTPTASGLCAGVYKVTVTDSNQCKVYQTFVLYNTVGIEQPDIETQIGVYPNPGENGIFNLEITSHSKELFIVNIYNNLGKRIFTSSVEVSGKSREIIDLSQYASGIYYLQIVNDKQIIDTRNLIVR